MSIGWSSMPLLPLRCILDHLSMEDALAAMSTCHHWRSAILLYEGRRDTLKLRTKHLEKNMFLTRIFKKYTRKLHIYIDCSQDELEKFMNYVLPQFYDTQKLNEVVFVGLGYTQQNPHMPVVKLKRIVTESLVFKHLQCIKKFALMGCEMDVIKNGKERYTHDNVEYFSRSLSFKDIPTASDSVLSTSNIGLMMFSTLQHIVMDYDLLSTESLETLSNLPLFSHLTMNICYKRQMSLEPINWLRLQSCFGDRLEVSVNIITLPQKKFTEVIENVLVDGLTLVSLKVMFCKTMNSNLIKHIVRLYKTTLRELVWADCPFDSTDVYHRVIKSVRQTGYDYTNVNPFILLCWQCNQLRRLAIHGYWIWQYDVVGFVRLRKSLRRLEVSSLFEREGRYSAPAGGEPVLRVLAADAHRPLDTHYVKQVSQYMEYDWEPTPWNKLHPALRARSVPEERADYIVQEARQTIGVTLY